MSNNNAYRTISLTEEQAKCGVLFETWTGSWGIKITPWYSMDKVKFAFIDKGANGKGKSFDVCVPTIRQDAGMDFETMMHEVLMDTRLILVDFRTALLQEQKNGKQYPERYKFVTGDNGEKSVGFCNSRNGGYCINGSTVIDGKRINANIPISYYALIYIMQNYKDTYQPRRDELKSLRLKGISDAEAERKKYSDGKQNGQKGSGQQNTAPQNGQGRPVQQQMQNRQPMPANVAQNPQNGPSRPAQQQMQNRQPMPANVAQNPQNGPAKPVQQQMQNRQPMPANVAQNPQNGQGRPVQQQMQNRQQAPANGTVSQQNNASTVPQNGQQTAGNTQQNPYTNPMYSGNFVPAGNAYYQ